MLTSPSLTAEGYASVQSRKRDPYVSIRESNDDHRARGRRGGAGEHVRSYPGRVRAWPVAAAQQLGPLGGSIPGRRLRGADTRVARRPETTTEASAHPEVFAHKSIGQVADHFAAIIATLAIKPTVIGHSFGGLLAQILAGRGLAAVSVAIDPAPFRGVLPLPISALRSASAALGNPANRHRAVPLTYDQFRYAFANAVSEDEAKELYETFAVPAPGLPLFQAAAANLNPWTEAKVDTGESRPRPDAAHLRREGSHRSVGDHLRLLQAAEHNKGVTEIVEIPNRGHALTIDSGWREVADTASRSPSGSPTRSQPGPEPQVPYAVKRRKATGNPAAHVPRREDIYGPGPERQGSGGHRSGQGHRPGRHQGARG